MSATLPQHEQFMIELQEFITGRTGGQRMTDEEVGVVLSGLAMVYATNMCVMLGITRTEDLRQVAIALVAAAEKAVVRIIIERN